MSMDPHSFNKLQKIDSNIGHMFGFIGLSYNDIIEGMRDQHQWNTWPVTLAAYPIPSTEDM